ncbi:retrovirus-related pol polyprotein from transposon TNT 1-94 [Tanacetum coccineum]
MSNHQKTRNKRFCFVGGSWSDSGEEDDEKVKNETYLVAQASSEECFILNTKDYLTKFDPKSYEGVFLGYSQNSKSYIILNKHTIKIEESLNVTFDETLQPSKTSPLVDDDLDEVEATKDTEKKNLENNIEDETLEIDEVVNIKESRNHPLEHDESWIIAMQEELNKFIANDVWELVPQLKNIKIIGTKWVYRNKLDENGVVSRNKARLVAQSYNQQEGIDYDETYAPIARCIPGRFYHEVVYVHNPRSSLFLEKHGSVNKLKESFVWY